MMRKTEHTRVFTDGSWDHGTRNGGWSFVVRQNGREIHTANGSETNTTNIRMEMQAMISALRWLSDNPQAGSVEAVSDCKYVVSGLNDWRHRWKRNGWKKSPNRREHVKNKDLWVELDELADSLPVTFKWEKGHAGCPHNGKAHRLANMARVDGDQSTSASPLATGEIPQLSTDRVPCGFFGVAPPGMQARADAARILYQAGDIDTDTFLSALRRQQSLSPTAPSLLTMPARTPTSALAAALANLSNRKRYGSTTISNGSV